MQRYDEFRLHPVVKSLNAEMSWGAYEIFADVAETLLFGYYLKFGTQYIAETLYGIVQLLALHRYNNGRVWGDGSGVRQFVSENEIVMMIDQASSPTFFLAEILSRHELLCRNWALCPSDTLFGTVSIIYLLSGFLWHKPKNRCMNFWESVKFAG